MADRFTWAEPGLNPFLPVRAIILLCHDLSQKEHGHKHCCHMLSTYRCLTSVHQTVLTERPVGRCLVPDDRLLLAPALAPALADESRSLGWAYGRSPGWAHTDKHMDKVKDGPYEAGGADLKVGCKA